MPPRACIDCPKPAIAGRSRCSTHGPTSPKGPSPYDSAHKRNAKKVRANATDCAKCGGPFTASNPSEGAHIVAREHGGQNVEGNYEAWCRRCNRSDGAKIALEKRRGRFSP